MNLVRFVLYALALLPIAANPATGAEASEEAQLDPMLNLVLAEPEMNLSAAALAHIIGGEGLPTTSDLISADWPSGVLELLDGAKIPVSMSMQFRVGPAFPVNEANLTILDSVTGRLTVNLNGGKVLWNIEQANYGGYFPKTMYNPETKGMPLGVHLPVVLRNPVSGKAIQTHMFLSFHYRPETKRLAWNKAFLRTLYGRGPAAQQSRLEDIQTVLASQPSAATAAREASKKGDESALLHIRANHTSRPAAFATGTGLQRLITVSTDALPQCTDDPSVMDVEFTGTTMNDRLAIIRLNILPAVSWRDGDAIRSLLESVTGYLKVGDENSSKVWRISTENRDTKIAGAVYLPARRQLTFSIPAVFEDSANKPFFGDIEIQCSMDDEQLLCDEIHVDEVQVSGAGGSFAVAFASPTGALFDAGGDWNTPMTDQGCLISCANCHLGGCTFCTDVVGCSGCQAGGSQHCCYGAVHCGCRTCSCSGTSVVAVVTEAGITPVGECSNRLSRTVASTNGGPNLLLPEWTVLGYQDGRLQVHNASSFDIAGSDAACVPSGYLPSEDGEFALVVDHRPHVQNERYMPEPAVLFAPQPVGGRTGAATVKAAAKVDVDDAGQIVRADILYATANLPSSVLASIRDGTRIAFEDDRRHPFSVFAIFTIADDLVQLDQSFVAIPQCCSQCNPICPSPGE